MVSSQTGTSSKRAKIYLEIYNTSSCSFRIYRNGVFLHIIIYTNVRSYIGQLGSYINWCSVEKLLFTLFDNVVHS